MAQKQYSSMIGPAPTSNPGLSQAYQQASDAARSRRSSGNPLQAAPSQYMTRLTAGQEQQFQKWLHSNRVPWRDIRASGLDMRSYWLIQQEGLPASLMGDQAMSPSEMRGAINLLNFTESQQGGQ